ncbi:hypothetical protein Cflav_PD1140 [Pedosphaera parvula Ellin514]|uniref:Uncharacterized protein n=1 Tax=Pedosphaera parvula (strain Ellin514) TaxID=320771 RepID=B9XQE1_PEDPL|nr:hypothetical protein Cflav_PD1140 [Pedosphaera parvula Ellin514]
MKALNTLATVIDRCIWTVGVFAILIYAEEHWPLPYRVFTFCFLLGFGVWYLWKFFIQPFRAGLRGANDDGKHGV